ncbi:MAG: aminotransferase class I/II-fold pyridoxal phosphate-dependent enzyme [bacterium]
MKFPRTEKIRISKVREIYNQASPQCIDLGIGKPFCSTPSHIKKKACSAIKENYTSYTHTRGVKELRKAVAERYNLKHSVPITADNVLITCGVAEAIFISMFSLLRKNDQTLVPDPGYPAYPAIAELLQAIPVFYPLSIEHQFGIQAEQIIPRINSQTKVILINSPSNPTGGINNKKELEKIALYLKNKEIMVISDQVYSRLNYTHNPVPSLTDFLDLDRTILLSGVSKEFSMTGWRIGWAVSSEKNIHELTKSHLYQVSCAPSISQKAALEALYSESEEVKNCMLKNKNLMLHELEKISDLRYIIPDAGLYFFVNVSHYGSGDKICRDILNEVEVITIPGSGFGKEGKNYIRLSFGASPENIKEGMKRLQHFFKLKIQ